MKVIGFIYRIYLWVVFFRMFIDWVESNKFNCGGTIYPLDEKGERI